MYNRNSFSALAATITASGVLIIAGVFISRYHKKHYNSNKITTNEKNRKNVIADNDNDDETNDISEKKHLNQSTYASSSSDNNDSMIIHRLEQQRQEERTGRLRAEIKLRQVTKELQQMKNDIIRLNLNIKNTEVLGNNIPALDNNNDDDDHEKTNVHSTNDDESNVLQSHDRNKTLRIDDSTKNINNNNNNIKSKTLLMDSIGMIRSPYTKRMGTPRQPQLVPNSYGYIQFFTSNCPSSTLDGIMDYSHIWIIFEFHANTTTPINNNDKNGNNKQQQRKTKIRPPRAPKHIKIGQLASRSPHRPNPIGLSLVKLEYWESNKQILYISGIDLVNNTPIYDIKPFVPWDIPGYYQFTKITNLQHPIQSSSLTINTTNEVNESPLNQQEEQNNDDLSSKSILLSSLNIKVPEWVIQEDEITIVQFSNESIEALEAAISNGYLEPFYCSKNFDIISNFTFLSCENNNASTTIDDKTIENDDTTMKAFVLEQAKLAIQQILAQDPRSSHKGLKINARGTKLQNNNNITSNNNDNISTNITTDKNDIDNNNNETTSSSIINCNNATSYHIIFGQIRVTFCVLEIGVYVTCIEPITFHPDNYVDGIPLMLDIR